MIRAQIFSAILLFVLAAWLLADGTTVVVKVNGRYGIISKGANQGITEGQIFFVRREGISGQLDVGKAKVIRVTANRAAIEQTFGQKNDFLRKGDILFTARELSQIQKNSTRDAAAPSSSQFLSAKAKTVTAQPGPSTSAEPTAITGKEEGENFEYKARTTRKEPKVTKAGNTLRKPWVNFALGAMIPNGRLAQVSSSGILLNASYMVSVVDALNMGVEVSQSFMNGGLVDPLQPAAGSMSASLLSAMLVFQRFMGDNLFLEVGGGLSRPKLTQSASDGSKLSYSSTYFGILGGAGIFVPTSPFAGIIMKGRINNYFDDTSKCYWGLTGGFRFKIR